MRLRRVIRRRQQLDRLTSITPSRIAAGTLVISLRETHRGVTLVTGKAFVAAIAIQSDRHMLSRLARNIVLGMADESA